MSWISWTCKRIKGPRAYQVRLKYFGEFGKTQKLSKFWKIERFFHSLFGVFQLSLITPVPNGRTRIWSVRFRGCASPARRGRDSSRFRTLPRDRWRSDSSHNSGIPERAGCPAQTIPFPLPSRVRLYVRVPKYWWLWNFQNKANKSHKLSAMKPLP